MNERIKELKIKSLEWNEELEAWVPNDEKFAELIVQECANVSERTGALNEADYEGEMIADAIKEHFGVE